MRRFRLEAPACSTEGAAALYDNVTGRYLGTVLLTPDARAAFDATLDVDADPHDTAARLAMLADRNADTEETPFADRVIAWSLIIPACPRVVRDAYLRAVDKREATR